MTGSVLQNVIPRHATSMNPPVNRHPLFVIVDRHMTATTMLRRNLLPSVCMGFFPVIIEGEFMNQILAFGCVLLTCNNQTQSLHAKTKASVFVSNDHFS